MGPGGGGPRETFLQEKEKIADERMAEPALFEDRSINNGWREMDKNAVDDEMGMKKKKANRKNRGIKLGKRKKLKVL